MEFLSGFKPKPIEPRDVSSYSGIEFETWHEGAFPEEVRIYLEISPYRLIQVYEGHHLYDFTQYAKSEVPIKVTAPFSSFEQAPEYQGDKVPFHKDFQREVYQIAIVIQGRKGHVSQGKIMIDNIKFFK